MSRQEMLCRDNLGIVASWQFLNVALMAASCFKVALKSRHVEINEIIIRAHKF